MIGRKKWRGVSHNAGGEVAKYEESYVPLGILIARTSSSRADPVTIVDKQALENDRIMGNGAINLPIK